MRHQCRVCGKIVSEALAGFVPQAEDRIVDLIKKQHPDWVELEEVCPRCLDYYRKQMKGNEV